MGIMQLPIMLTVSEGIIEDLDCWTREKIEQLT